MKTCHIFLFLLTIVTVKAQSHDYQTVYPDQTVLFKNSLGYRISGLRVDSVRVAAADTILYPFATIQAVDRSIAILLTKLRGSAKKWS